MEIKDSKNSIQNILLVDSSSNISKIKDFQEKCDLIISFDLETHRLLEKNSLNHKISEEYISNEELGIIDHECMRYCKWYEQKNGNELLAYENINLGSLFSPELNNFLIPFLKNLLVIDKLSKQFSISNFYCSKIIYNILQKLVKNVTLIDNSSTNKINSNKIQYNIFDKIPITVSKENFQKLKNISNKLTSLLIKNNNHKNTKNTIVLVEFDPIKYETLFKMSNKINDTVFLYNRRRPIIYNTKSFKILKNSHIIPFINNKFHNDNDNKLSKSVKIVSKNAQLFFNDDKFLNSFFKFNELSFWNYLKPFLIEFYNNKIQNFIFEIEESKNFFQKEAPSTVVVLSENGITEQIMLKIAKKYHVKSILMQHGIMMENPSSVNYGEILGGYFPVLSDFFFGWGNTSIQYVNASSICNAKNISIGSPNLDRIFSKKNIVSNSSDDILLITTAPRNSQCVGHNVNEWEKYETLISAICRIVLKNNQNLIIKRHPDPEAFDFSENFYHDFPNVEVLKNSEITDLLLKSKIVISVGLSTSIFEAQVLGKPVISIISDHDVYGTSKSISTSCFETKLENFEEVFSKLLIDDEFYSKKIKACNIELKENFHNIGNSSQIIFDNLKKLDEF